MKYQGLGKDANYTDFPNGFGPHARNIIKSDKLEAITQEHGFDFINTLDKYVIGIFIFDNRIVICSGEDTTSEIGIYENGSYTTVVTSAALEFNYFAPIEAVGYLNTKNEIIVCWWNGVTEFSSQPKILNLDCLPFEVDVNGVPVDIEDLDSLYLFTKYTKGTITVDKIENTGGILTTGAKYFLLAFEHQDGSVSNYFHITNSVFIVDDEFRNLDNDTLDVDYKPYEYNTFDGAPAGTSTSKSITLSFNDLPSWVKKVQLGIIHKTGGVVTASYVPSISINENGTFRYTGLQDIDTSVDALLVPAVTYSRIQAGTILNDQLVIGNLKEIKAPEIQPYINAAVVDYTFEDEISLTKVWKNDGIDIDDISNYKDLTFLVDHRTFKSNEVYALYLLVHLINGNIVAYHIPGREPLEITFTTEDGNIVTCMENALITDLLVIYPSDVQLLEWKKIGGSNARLHEFYGAPGNGMCYWENQNEFYPVADCWAIDGTEDTLSGQKVRHHKFPSAAALNDEAGFYTEGDNNTPLIAYLESVGIVANLATWNNVTDNTADFGITLLASNVGMTLQFDGRFRIRFQFRVEHNSGGQIEGFFTITSSNGAISHFYLNFNAWSGNLNVGLNSTDNGTREFGVCVFIEAKAGDEIRWTFSTDNADTEIETGKIWIEDWGFNSLDIRTKLLGISISNLVIPEELQAEVAYYELGYAERSNGTIVASGLIEGGDYTTIGFHSPDLELGDAPLASRINYVETQLNIDVMSDCLFIPDITDVITHNRWRKLDNVKYIPPFSFIDGIDNSKREGYLYADLITDFSGTGLASGKTYLYAYADLKTYRTDLYSNFKDQTIVRSGSIIATPFESKMPPFYGGDCFNSIFGYYTIYKAIMEADEAAITEFKETFLVPSFANETDYYYTFYARLYMAESIKNVNLRHSESDTDMYAPKWAVPTKLINTEQSPGGVVGNYQEKVIDQILNPTTYNEDYHSLNNIQAIQVYDCEVECGNDISNSYPQRVHKSLPLLSESNAFRWRNFLANDYIDMPRKRREVWVLRDYNKALIIHQRNGLHVAYIKDTLSQSEGLVYLGTGDIFDRQPDEVLHTSEGYAGCQNKFAAQVTKVGYFFVDRKNGNIFLFNGKLNEISNSNQGLLKRWFYDNLNLLYDEDFEDMEDNPFTGKGFTLGYDNKFNRIILSKNNTGGGILEGTEDDAKNWTISYDLFNQMWLCFHDYVPSYMFWSRAGLFSIKTFESSGDLYRHNSLTADKCVFYGDESFDSYFDLVFTGAGKVVLWTNVKLWTIGITEDGNTDYSASQVTGIMLYNDHQNTGLVTLTTSGDTVLVNNVRQSLYNWQFNKFKDVVLNKDVINIDQYGKLNDSNIGQTTWYKKTPINSNFVIVRVQVTSTGTGSIYVKDVIVEGYIKKQIQ